ncbi:hypothetical protein SNE40_019578 [Patella caerulea]|uniref:Hairy and enhancer of split-related protein HELT n=1 Tax=Patella caerulea TaxID=87958 RepID=A0AAN8PAK6_PATCE
MEMERSSHKVIEKRRRDRINNCLAELSQSVPSVFAKQTSGKLEKAEILEMTVEYLRAIQATDIGIRFENGEWFSGDIWSDFIQHYQLGYNDCIREVVRYMTDVEGMGLNDNRCVRILSYLQTRFRPDSSITGAGTHRPTMQRLLIPNKNSNLSQDTKIHHNLPARRYSPYSTSTNIQSRLNDSFSTERKTIAVSPSRVYPLMASNIRPLSKVPHPLPFNMSPFQYETMSERHIIPTSVHNSSQYK